MHQLRTFLRYNLAICFSLMLVSAAVFGQDQPTGIPQIDEAYHQRGYNIIAHEVLDLGPQGLSLPQTSTLGEESRRLVP